MHRNRIGCLVLLLIFAVIVALLALGAALVVMNWSAGGAGPIPLQLPTYAAPRLPAPTLAPIAPLPTPTPPAAATPGPATTPAPEMLTLTDPTLNELGERLAGVQPGQSVRIVMSEEALRAELARNLAGVAGGGYEYQSVDLKNGRLVIAGRGRMDNLVVNMEVTARPYVEKCWFTVDVEGVKLGKFPAPRFVADQIEGYVTQWTEAYRDSATQVACITEITITETSMTLAGWRR